MASVASRIRCSTDKIKTLEITFGADAPSNVFVGLGGSAHARNVIGMPMGSIDISDDAEGVLLYAAERIEVNRATWHSFDAGAKIYYDGTNNEFSGTGTNQMLAGLVLVDTAAGVATAEIEFDGSLLMRAIT